MQTLFLALNDIAGLERLQPPELHSAAMVLLSESLGVNLFVGIIIFLFACMFLTLFGFVSYSFGHWILSIFRWFHARHVARFGQEGLATLVAKRSSLMTSRGGPLTLVVTLEYRSADNVLHRREFQK